MATLLKVLNNHADIKSAGGVALGLGTQDVPYRRKGRKNSSKYVYLDEIAEHFGARRSTLIYQHYPREHRAVFLANTANRLSGALPTRTFGSSRPRTSSSCLRRESNMRDGPRALRSKLRVRGRRDSSKHSDTNSHEPSAGPLGE